MARPKMTVGDYLPRPGEEPRSGWEVLAARLALDDNPQGLTVWVLDSVGDALAKAFKAGREYEGATGSRDDLNIVIAVCDELGIHHDSSQGDIVERIRALQNHALQAPALPAVTA